MLKKFFKMSPNTAKTYNPEVDILRLIFAIAVFLHHFNGIPNFTSFLPRGFLAVEFFFMISGYFMAHKLQSKDSPEVDTFIFKKIAPIYPVVLVSTLIAFVLRLIPIAGLSLKGWLVSIPTSFFEVSMLWMQGLFVGRTYNTPSWYISAMIIAMAVIYPLFKRYWNYFSGIGSLVLSLVCYSIIFNNSPKISSFRVFWFITTLGVIRAIAGLSLGVFLYNCSLRVTRSFSITSIGNYIFMAIKLILLALICLYMWKGTVLKGVAKWDYVIVVFIFAFLFLVFSRWGSITILNKFDFRWCNSFSLYLYLNHYGIRHFLRDANLDLTKGQTLFVFLSGVVLSMVLCYFGVRYGSRLLKALSKHIFIPRETSPNERVS